MRPIILNVFLLLLTTQLHGQTSIYSLALDKNERIDGVSQHENGIIVQTVIPIGNVKSDHKLIYLSNNPELGYKIDINQPMRMGSLITEESPSGNSQFILLSKYNSDPYAIIHVDKNGNQKNFSVEKQEKLGELKFRFATDQFLYHLYSSLDKVERKDGRKHLLEQISDTGVKSYKFEFPEYRDPKNSGKWNYVSHSEAGLYFASKTVLEKGIFLIDMVLLNYEGKIIKKISLDASLMDKSVWPSSDYKRKRYMSDKIPDYPDPDFIIGEYGKTPRISAHGVIKVDEKNEAIYVAGVSGAKPMSFMGTPNDSYFIAKYNLGGSLLWKKQYEYPSLVKDDGFLTNHAAGSSREIKIVILPDGMIRFQLQCRAELYTFHLNNTDGAFQNVYRYTIFNRDLSAFQHGYNSEEDSPTVKYVKSLEPNSKSNLTYIFPLKSGDLVMHSNKTEVKFVLIEKK